MAEAFWNALFSPKRVHEPKPAPPPSPKVFEKQWRTPAWDSKRKELLYMKEYRPGNPRVETLRIMVYGPVGAGKSSFINSVNSALQERMTGDALVDAKSGASYTQMYKAHPLKNGPTTYPFVFNDVMGLENESNKGSRPEDIILALKGHVPNMYKFNPAAPLSEDDAEYVNSPSLNDKVHCLVCVIPTDQVAIMNAEVIAKMREIRLAASAMGIPQLAILTRIDAACPVVREDLRKVYLSIYIKQKMEEFSNKLGIPMNCIFPVKNYHEEIDVQDDVDVLILRVLRQILNFGDDYIRNVTCS